jgi:tRNA (guanine10-N2)-dimethyltransferase
VKLLFELSKEHVTLPKDEILSCLQAENIISNIIKSNENILIINAKSTYDKIKKLAQRLSFTYFIDELLFFCFPSLKEIKKYARNSTIKIDGSIAIDYKNRSNLIDSQPIIQQIAQIYTKNREVNLIHPDVQLRVVLTNSNVYTGLKIAKINRTQFERRKVQYRPFFSPISLHPKIARALVNLSNIKTNEKLLDPFCGTGGILLEGGLIGAKVIGSDIKEEMINGCKKTLDFYNISDFRLYCSDIGEIRNYISKVDAVVTDLPYGKSTTTKGEDIQNLYNRAFETVATASTLLI